MTILTESELQALSREAAQALLKVVPSAVAEKIMVRVLADSGWSYDTQGTREGCYFRQDGSVVMESITADQGGPMTTWAVATMRALIALKGKT